MLKIILFTLGLMGIGSYGLGFIVDFLGLATGVGVVLGTFLGLGIGVLYSFPAWNAYMISKITGVGSVNKVS